VLFSKIGVIPRKKKFMNKIPRVPKRIWQGNNKEAEAAIKEEAVGLVVEVAGGPKEVKGSPPPLPLNKE
jgi:hypothetical protein